jgi:hypothetical protein
MAHFVRLLWPEAQFLDLRNGERMITFDLCRRAFIAGILFALAALLLRVSAAAADAEQRLDTLQIGTVTYSNVTVTTKTKEYVFILHSSGMKNLKISQLTPEERELLGLTPPKPKPSTNAATVWARQSLAKVEVPAQLKAMESQIQERLGINGKSPAEQLRLLLNLKVIGIVCGILLFCHLFFSYCCMLICRKAGSEPGFLVWLPVLQMFPMLRAAAMSGWWFLANFVPVLNIIGQVLWIFKIVQARGKSVWVAIMMLLPVTNLFAFLYLAFSNGVKRQERKIEIMTLEAA